jgi:hypothetical protein
MSLMLFKKIIFILQFINHLYLLWDSELKKKFKTSIVLNFFINIILSTWIH